jgi:hypothetical protein
MMRNLGIILAFLFMLAVAAVSASAQTLSTANVNGTVTDPSGAVVPGASVVMVDTSTNEARTTQTNKAGHYEFVGLRVGVYTITAEAKGFRKAAITNATLEVGKDYTFNVSLEVGAATQTVEVRATVGAELQTMNSTMGTSLSGSALLNMPSADRDVSGLLYFLPTASPSYGGDPGTNETGGQIAGAMSDENTFLLDGGSNTSVLEGDNGYGSAYGGTFSAGRGVVPTPMESVDEFKVNTNNMTADFSSSTGGEVMVVTKRGTNQFHGAAYDYFQSSALDSNDWYNNFVGDPKPKAHANRFGGAVGGPLLPPLLGGKTYFFMNYEGQRYPRSGPVETTVPSDMLRSGILQLKDASGNPVQYNMKTSTQCGPTGGLPCDPRGIGLNPVATQMWSQYEPEPNDMHYGDRLNTFGYRGDLSYPLRDDFGVVRLDHDFGSKLRWFTSYRMWKEDNPNTHQVDYGGLLPGDTKGQPASASSMPNQPRMIVTGLNTTVSPNLTNDFHFSFNRNYWAWRRAGAVPQISGIPGAMEFGESANMIPMNIDTQNSRKRLWIAHDFDYRDTLTWLHGTHLFQFGGEARHIWMHFDRYDNVVGGLTQLVYELANGSSVVMDPKYLPQPCSGTLSTNCLPDNEISTYKTWYGELLGIVGQSSVVATRTGANLNLNPLGTPLSSFDKDDDYSLYFSDAWKIKPNLTLSYGLNYSVQMPPYELNGEQDIEVDSTGNIITPENYLANRLTAAQNGQNFNPLIGFSPIGAVGGGLKYPYAPFYGGFAPRVSLAWSPNVTEGWLGKLFGGKSTVIRGGYARFYDRINAIDQIAGPTLGDGFLEPVSCYGASKSGQCLGVSGVDPTNAFRIGVDGNVAPFPAISQTLASPVQPGVNAPYSPLAESLGYNFRPGSSDQIDFSIQRQLKGDMILEVGYVGRWAKHIYQGLDLNDVPWMMNVGGQTFAQAYANLWSALSGQALPGKSVPSLTATQPFFEKALAGSAYCGGFASCTAAVASQESGNILTNSVTSLWSDLDGSFVFGPALLSSTQANLALADTTNGFSNYQALVVSLQKRASHGLTFNGNLTYGHSLGTYSINQEYTEADSTNPWNLRTDYGPQVWDRKATVNIAGSYELPFSKGRRFASSNPVLSRLIGGWSISPVFTFGTGLPMPVYTGSCQEFGEGFAGICGGAVPMTDTAKLSNSPHFGITSNGVTGYTGDNAYGGPGINIFGNNAAQTFTEFRPIFPGIDGRSMASGNLRGLSRYNLDLALNKDTRITERVGVQFYVQMFNAINHMEFADPCWNSPCLNLLDQPDWGVINSQFNVQNNQYTRQIQLGLRVSF